MKHVARVFLVGPQTAQFRALERKRIDVIYADYGADLPLRSCRVRGQRAGVQGDGWIDPKFFIRVPFPRVRTSL